ncbi:replication initiation protein [Maritalea sp.]|uniref:replication initiation protein n=1 Tax=Maritalea sp. TaxID=2003361 RepID=UPI003EF600B2
MAKKKELKKHSSAIHTNGKLSLLERKLSNVLLYNAYDDLLTQRVHSINIYALAEVSGFNSHNVEVLKDAIRNLASVKIEWDIRNEDGSTKWGISTLLSSVEIEKGVCSYEYSRALSEKFASPELYGIINLEIQKTFTSSYTLTIYEICSRYKGILRNRETAYTPWYSLEEFKKFLGIEDSEYYSIFKELNRKIIKPSVSEISGSLKKYIGTDIVIVPEFKRIGRTVADIRFKITSNKQIPLALENREYEAIRKTEHYSQLVEFGMSDKGAIHVIKTTEPEQLTRNIEATQQAVQAGSIASSVTGFLSQAIKDDYKPKVTKTEKQKEEEKRKKQLALEQKAKEAQQAELEKQRKATSKLIRSEYIQALSEDVQANLLEKLKEDKPQAIKKLIKSLESPQIASELDAMIPGFEEELDSRLEA